LIEITSRHQQTQRTLLDWLRVECPEKEVGRRKNSEGKGGGHFYSAIQQGRAGSEELGEESPGWPIKCLAVPSKPLPVSRGDLSRPANPQARLSALRVIAGLLPVIGNGAKTAQNLSKSLSLLPQSHFPKAALAAPRDTFKTRFV
jgi:hypothetical protein